MKTVAPLFLLLITTCSGIKAECPTNVTSVFYGNGIDTDKKHANLSKQSLQIAVDNALNVRNPVRDVSCVTYSLAYDSEFVTSDKNKNITVVNFFAQLLHAAILKGITDLPAFWDWLFGISAPPDWLAQDYLDLVSPIVAAYQPDLKIHVQEYNAALNSGSNVVVVAHSEGNLYANQASALVTVPNGQAFNIVAVASPASFVPNGDPWVTLGNDIILLVPGSPLPLDVSNNTPTLCNASALDVAARWNCHDFDHSYMMGDNSEPTIVNDVVATVPSATAGPHSIVPMDALPGPPWVYPSGMNNSGEVVGGYNYKAFAWSAQGGYQFLSLAPGDQAGSAIAINDSGNVVGYGYKSLITYHALRWGPVGSVEDLGLLVGEPSAATNINDFGLVAGYTGAYAFLWSQASGRTLLPGANSAAYIALNNLGHAAGVASSGNTGKVVLWKGSTTVVDTGISGVVSGLNDHDELIGVYAPAAGSTGFIWSPLSGIQQIPTLYSGCSVSLPKGINDNSQIVGVAMCLGQRFYAFIYQSGTIQDLNSLIPADSNWQLLEADAINDQGEVVGYGLLNGAERGFLLTPIIK